MRGGRQGKVLDYKGFFMKSLHLSFIFSKNLRFKGHPSLHRGGWRLGTGAEGQGERGAPP